MKKYNIVWEQSMSVIIEANTEDEALERFWNDEHKANDETFGEYTLQPEAYEVK